MAFRRECSLPRSAYLLRQTQCTRCGATLQVSGRSCGEKRCQDRTQRRRRMLGSTWRAPWQSLLKEQQNSILVIDKQQSGVYLYEHRLESSALVLVVA